MDYTLSAWQLAEGDRIILSADLVGTVRHMTRDPRNPADIRYRIFVLGDDGSTHSLDLGRLEDVDLVGCHHAPECSDCGDTIAACDLVHVDAQTYHRGCAPALGDDPVERDDRRSWALGTYR